MFCFPDHNLLANTTMIKITTFKEWFLANIHGKSNAEMIKNGQWLEPGCYEFERIYKDNEPFLVLKGTGFGAAEAAWAALTYDIGDYRIIIEEIDDIPVQKPATINKTGKILITFKQALV